MKLFLRIAPAVLLIFLCVGFVCAQEQDRPMPDRWRGLILDQSTHEDVIRVLGKPKSDKPSELSVQRKRPEHPAPTDRGWATIIRPAFAGLNSKLFVELPFPPEETN